MRPQQLPPAGALPHVPLMQQPPAPSYPAQAPTPAPVIYINNHSANNVQPAAAASVPSASLPSFARPPPPLNTALSPVPLLSSLVSPNASRSRSPAPPVPGPPPQSSPFSHPPPSFVAPFPYARAPLLPYNALSPMSSSPASPTAAAAGKQLHPFTFPLPSPTSPAPPLPSPPSLNPAISTGAATLPLPRPPALSIPRGPSPVPSSAVSSSPRTYFVTDEGAVSVPPSTGSSPTGLHRQHFYPSVPPLQQQQPQLHHSLPQHHGGVPDLYVAPAPSRATSANGLPPGMTLPQHPQPMQRAVSSSQQPHAQPYAVPLPPSHNTAAAHPSSSFQHPLPARAFVPEQTSASLPYHPSPTWLPSSTAAPSSHAAMPAYPAAPAQAFPSTSVQAPFFPPRFQWVTPVHPAHLQLACSHFPESPELFDACPLPFGVLMNPLGPGLSLPASDTYTAPSSAIFSPAASTTPSQVHAASPSTSGGQVFTFPAGHASAASISGSPLSSSSSAAAYHAPTPLIPTVRPGAAGVVRCKECKAYMNGYVLWLEQGRAWRCNICNADNSTPSSYYSPLNADGRRVDWDDREELRNASYEIVAPKDYMVRPPVPPLICLCIDVSRESRDRGLLADVCSIFTQLVEDMARNPKALLSILTFSDSVHYFTINNRGKGPVMHVLTTLDDLFLPSPVGLLVRVAECKSQLLSLLASLPTIHQPSASGLPAASPASPTPTCTASALECCMMIMGRYGGRLIVFTSSLCSAGRGLMTDRERAATEGKGAQDAGGLEAALLKPGSDYYKKLSDTMQKHQITCDLLFFPPSFSSSPLSPPAYVDVSSHADLARYTGGQLYYFPRYSSSQGFSALRATLTAIVMRPQCFESVFRVRCSRGVGISDFHGHFSIRGTDLLSIPCCDCEKSISFELRIDDKDRQYVSGNKDRVVVIQTGLLYTSFTGERRIVVHTAVVPLAKDVRRLLQAVNVSVCIGIMSKRAVWLAYAHSLQQARDFVRQKCSALVRTMQKAGFPVPLHSPSQPYAAAASFSQLSLYLLKSCFAQQSPALFIPSDQRCVLLCTLYVLPLHDCMRLVQPLLCPLHYLLHDQRYGTLCPPWTDPAAPPSDPAAAVQEVMWVPPACALTAASLSPDSLFLLHNGLYTIVRAGRAVDGGVMQHLFQQDDASGAPDSLRLRDADPMTTAAGGSGSSLLQRVWAVIDEVRKESSLKSRVQVVREGQQLDVLFTSMLADDARDKEPGVREWEASLQ